MTLILVLLVLAGFWCAVATTCVAVVLWKTRPNAPDWYRPRKRAPLYNGIASRSSPKRRAKVARRVALWLPPIITVGTIAVFAGCADVKTVHVQAPGCADDITETAVERWSDSGLQWEPHRDYADQAIDVECWDLSSLGFAGLARDDGELIVLHDALDDAHRLRTLVHELGHAALCISGHRDTPYSSAMSTPAGPPYPTAADRAMAVCGP